ncbi:MAG: M20/M25/M40 family metallo-hydrolase, partial [Nitrospinota bacterium]
MTSLEGDGVETVQPEQIDAAIEAQQEELLALVKQLIAFPTESPPARNTTAAQSFIARYLQELGFTVDQWEVAAGDPNVVGVLRGSDPDRYASLLINTHIDVAQVGDAQGWRYPPFEPVISAGRLYGRGASDMKGGLGAALFAIAILRRLGVSLRGDLLFESVVGEEMGEAGTKACVERGYRADFAICADTSDLELQGQGGVITGWITIESPQ